MREHEHIAERPRNGNGTTKKILRLGAIGAALLTLLVIAQLIYGALGKTYKHSEDHAVTLPKVVASESCIKERISVVESDVKELKSEMYTKRGRSKLDLIMDKLEIRTGPP